MKKLLIVVSLGLVACGSTGRAEQPTDFGAFAARHDEAWNQHDPTSMAALFSDDGTLVTPSGSRAEGQAELLALLSRPGPTNETTSTTRFEGIQWLGDDLVLLDGVQRLDGPGVEVLGTSEARVVAVARRDDGRWRLVAARPYVPAR